MRKGFEYWSGTDTRVLVAIYWVLFLAGFSFSLWAAARLRWNPFAVLFFGAIPYPFIKIYRAIRRPYPGLAYRIRHLDPSYYARLTAAAKAKMVKGLEAIPESILDAIMYREMYHDSKTSSLDVRKFF